MRSDIKFPEVYADMFWVVEMWDMLIMRANANPPGKYLVVQLRRTVRRKSSAVDKLLKRKPIESSMMLRWNTVDSKTPSAADIEAVARDIWEQYLSDCKEAECQRKLEAERQAEAKVTEWQLREFEGIYK